MKQENTKPRLVFFGVKYFPSRGGVSRTTEHLIRALKDKFDITIYCYRHPDARNHVPGVRAIQIPRLGPGSTGVFPYFFLCCMHMLFFGKYDIVHLRKIDSAFFLPLIRLKFKKVLATSHEQPYLSTKWTAFARAYFMMNERIYMKSPSTLNAISKSLCGYYKQRYGREVIYVPNGVNFLHEYNEKGADELLQKHRVTAPYIMWAARRVQASKGLHVFMDALHTLDYRGEVLVAGEYTHDREFMRKIENKPAYPRVKMIGYIADKSLLLALVSRARLFVFPSLSEGMSIMLLEATGTGTPVICSDIPPNTDVYDDTEVLYFRNEDAWHLSEQLKWALEHPDQMAVLAEKARDRARNEYSGDNMVRRYEELYRKLLGK